jgi:hypothetical protein
MLKGLDPAFKRSEARLRENSRWRCKTQTGCLVTGGVSLPQPTAVPSNLLLLSFRWARLNIVTIVQGDREVEPRILLIGFMI